MEADRLRDLIDDIRGNMPSEVRQAKAIVSDRADIISTAKREAEGIIRAAEEPGPSYGGSGGDYQAGSGKG